MTRFSEQQLGLAGILCVGMLTVACGSTTEPEAPPAPPAAEPAPAAAPAAEPAPAAAAEPAAAPAAAGVCGRATECCTAYVDAIQGASGNPAAQAMAGTLEQVRTTCATYGSLAGNAAAEPGCQTAIEGYRTGLGAMGLTVPAACE